MVTERRVQELDERLLRRRAGRKLWKGILISSQHCLISGSCSKHIINAKHEEDDGGESPASVCYSSPSPCRKGPLEEEGLHCSILASLPVLKIFQLRSVCKLWNDIVTSQAFLKAWACKHIHHINAQPVAACCSPWLVMVRKPPERPPFDINFREHVAFDSGLGTWISLRELMSISCSGAALASLGGPSLPFVVHHTVLPNFWTVGSQFCGDGFDQGAGLICFLCSPGHSLAEFQPRDRFSYYVVVLNPLTGSHTILPPPLKHTASFLSSYNISISLQVLPHGEYRVFLRASLLLVHDYPGDIEIYDSCTESWTTGRSCTSLHDVGWIGDVKVLERADFLQFKYTSGYLFAYNIGLDEWTHVSACLKYMFHPILIRHRGRVLVASVQMKTGAAAPLEGFAVFELHLPYLAGAADWVEVARTPRRLWEGFYEASDRCGPFSVTMISSGSLICMTAVSRFYRRQEGILYYVPLVYDVDRDFWYHLPPYKGGYDVAAVCGMRPSLAAVA